MNQLGIAAKLNEGFPDALVAIMKRRFDLDVRNEWSLVSDSLYTNRVDDQDFTPEQYAFIDGYSQGYCAAMEAASQ